MKERPILFSGPMVRAIFEDRKTQTRRPILPRKGERIGFYTSDQDVEVVRYDLDGDLIDAEPIRCPYGAAGDRLWVRETWGIGSRPHPIHGWVDGVEHRADQGWLGDGEYLELSPIPDGIEYDIYDRYLDKGWRPSIHMPRWACRLTLDVLSTRPERLGDITEADARAEGFASRQEFLSEWDSIYMKRAPVAADPLVWCIEFRKLDQKASEQ